MEFEKPIDESEYKSLYEELYVNKGGRVVSQYSVPLDADPTMNPKAINQKLATVQAYKDRVVVILNRALQNESYWKSRLKSMESSYDHEVNMALTTDSVKGAGNAGLQKAVATRMACAVVVAKLVAKAKKANPGAAINEDLEYQDVLQSNSKRLAQATAFLNEVRNIYSNLDSASMALTVQLKSVMMNARLGGENWIHGGDDNGGRPS